MVRVKALEEGLLSETLLGCESTYDGRSLDAFMKELGLRDLWLVSKML
jgi:hypothetical protein